MQEPQSKTMSARFSFVIPTASSALFKREMMYMASRQRKPLPKPLNRRFWGDEADDKVDTKRICWFPFRGSRGNHVRRQGELCRDESP